MLRAHLIGESIGATRKKERRPAFFIDYGLLAPLYVASHRRKGLSLRYSDLLRALERARRLFATSETFARDDQDAFWVVPCPDCTGNQAFIQPAREGASFEPFPIYAAGDCPECNAIRAGWHCLDTGLSVTKQRLNATDTAALAKAYAVQIESFPSGRRLPAVNAIKIKPDQGKV